MTSNQEQLEERLGYRFAKRGAVGACVHPQLRDSGIAREPFSRSHAGLQPQDNEQLEFLGDAVLDMLASEYLLAAFPDWSEGQLSEEPGTDGERERAGACGQASAFG